MVKGTSAAHAPSHQTSLLDRPAVVHLKTPMPQVDPPPQRTARNSDTWTALGVAFIPVSFCILASLAHQLLPEKGSFGMVTHPHELLHFLTRHLFAAVLALLSAVCALVCLGLARRESGTAGILDFLNGRRGAALLLLSIGACQLPLYFTGGLMDYSDPLCHVNALMEAQANYRMWEWPFYTFHFANGTTLGLQYPMFRTLWGGMFACVSPFGPDVDYQILSAATHLFLMVGLYRLLRAWRFTRLACVIPALTLAGCHQMLVYYLAAAFSTFISSAFAVWCLEALARWFSSLRLRHGLACGFWLAFAVLGHPVTGLFTAYFLIPPILYFIWKGAGGEPKRFLIQGCGAAALSVAIALPYLVSVLAFKGFNSYHAGNVTAFQDSVVGIASNFAWINKYAGGQRRHGEETGEYISVILSGFILAGLAQWLFERFAGRRGTIGQRCFGFTALWLFFGGAILFYGRDTALVSAIPGVKLLKVNNRSFVFFAMGLALMAAKPIDRLVRGGHSSWILCLGALLFLEQCPYWLRPTYFSLPISQKLHADDFKGYDHETSSFLVIWPVSAVGLAIHEDVAFHRGGFSGISSIDKEERPVAGSESEEFHARMAAVTSIADAQAEINRLKWLRVTDVIWRNDALPSIHLESFGNVRAVTNGLALHLNGPNMERDLREARLRVAPADIQGSKTVLPIGFSPFLHCYSLVQPGSEIPLFNQGGYAAIDHPMPLGARLRIEAITPWWQSAVTWVSIVTTLCAGFVLLRRSAWRPSPGATPAEPLLP